MLTRRLASSSALRERGTRSPAGGWGEEGAARGKKGALELLSTKNVSFHVAGVLLAKGQSTQGTDQDDVLLIPFSTAERRVHGTQKLGTVGAILVSAVSAEAIPDAINQITMLLRDRHRVKRGQPDDITIRNLSEVAATAESTNRTIEYFIGQCGFC